MNKLFDENIQKQAKNHYFCLTYLLTKNISFPLASKQPEGYKKNSSKINAKWGEGDYWNWLQFYCYWKVLGGEGKRAIVFLHGFGASSSHWRFNADYFANQGFRVYAVDLIGFGQSEQPGPRKIKKLDNCFWASQLAAFLEEIVYKNGPRDAILIGNSLGGLVALTTQALYPNLVGAVVAAPLPDPALVQLQLNLPNWLKVLKDKLVRIFFNLIPLELLIPIILKTRLIKIALQSAYYSSIKYDSELLKIIIKPAQRRSAAKALRAMCIGMATRKKACTAPFLIKKIETNPIKTPILIAWGRKDNFVPLSIGKKLANQYPWIKLFIFENSGHCPHDESPSEFNQYVLNWLKSNLGQSIQNK